MALFALIFCSIIFMVFFGSLVYLLEQGVYEVCIACVYSMFVYILCKYLCLYEYMYNACFIYKV